MKNSLLLSVFIAFFILGCDNSKSESSAKDSQTKTAQAGEKERINLRWTFNSIDDFNQLPFKKQGDVKTSSSPWGTALEFDGDGDRLLVDANPFSLIGLSTDISQMQVVDGDAFTIEVILNPHDAKPESREPRFFHVEDASDPMRRLTLELRLNDQKQWWLDAFIKSELSNLTLIDSRLVHPVENWVHVAVTYHNRVFTTFVNGKQELSGEVDFLPIAASAKTSIGARMNEIHWFDGEIAAVTLTNGALLPDEFLLLPKITEFAAE